MSEAINTITEGYIKPEDRINYAVLSAEIVVDGDNKYLKRMLQDAEDDEEEPFNLVTFGANTVKLWENELMTKLGKTSATTADEMNLLDEKRRFIKYAGRIPYTFPEPMYKTWGSDGNHSIYINGVLLQQPHRKGDIVLDGRTGTPKLYTNALVFVKYKNQTSDIATAGYDYQTACADARRQFISPSQYVQGTAVPQTATAGQVPPAGNPADAFAQQGAPAQAPQQGAPVMQGLNQGQAPQQAPAQGAQPPF